MTSVILITYFAVSALTVTVGFAEFPRISFGSQPPRQQNASPTTPANQTVTLDVIALDKQGEPVTDLKVDEFHLRVNKQEQKIDSLAYSDSGPLAVGFVFDVSGSQHEDRWRDLELREAGELLHRIWRPGDEGFIGAFNDKVFVVSKPSHDLSKMDEGLTKLAHIVPRGSTALYDAICAIKVDQSSGARERRAVFVFSDFEDNASHIPLRNAPQCAQKAGFRIYSVPIAEEFVLSRRARKHALEAARELSEQTGGEVLQPQSKKDLSRIFAPVRGYLRSGYSISYSPVASDGDTKPEKIELSTSRKGLKLLYTKEHFPQ